MPAAEMPDDAAQPKQEKLVWASGHTFCRRVRFAYSLTGPFVAMSVIGMGKDLYILEFGASAGMIGSILLACSFACPMMDLTVGNLQDRGRFFRSWFPVSDWGRRAPWFLTHNTVLAILLVAFLMPPSKVPQVLIIWFTMIWPIGYWCVSASINAFEATRVEIYPSKEERVMLEQYCKVTVGIGAGVGSGVVSLCLTYPATRTFLVASALGCLTILSSTAAVQVLREAKSQKPVDQPGAMHGVAAAIRSGVVSRMCLLRFLQGIYETIMPTLQLYYFTFVFKMSKEDRLYWFVVGAAMMGFVELVLAPLWSQVFARSNRLMLYVPLACRLTDAVLAPIILLSLRSPQVFVCYLGFWRICNSSYSFWRVVACAWVCDHEGRGEGMMLGLFTMVNNLGRALTGSVAMLGLGWAGLVTFNCLEEEEGPARLLCEHDKIHNQPDSLRTYLVVMLAWGAPAFEILICALTYEFPIRPGSQLLADICQKKCSFRSEVAEASPQDSSQVLANQGAASPLPAILGQRGQQVTTPGPKSSPRGREGFAEHPSVPGNAALSVVDTTGIDSE